MVPARPGTLIEAAPMPANCSMAKRYNSAADDDGGCCCKLAGPENSFTVIRGALYVTDEPGCGPIAAPTSTSLTSMLSAENRAVSGRLTPEAVTLAILTLTGGCAAD